METRPEFKAVLNGINISKPKQKKEIKIKESTKKEILGYENTPHKRTWI